MNKQKVNRLSSFIEDGFEIDLGEEIGGVRFILVINLKVGHESWEVTEAEFQYFDKDNNQIRDDKKTHLALARSLEDWNWFDDMRSEIHTQIEDDLERSMYRD